MIKGAVVFDLDGTLVDTAPDLTASLNYTLITLGERPVGAEAVRHLVGHGGRALLRFGLGDAAGDELIERALPTFFEHYSRNVCVHSVPFPGVETALDSLRESGLSLAICSNKPEPLATALIDKLGWSPKFATIIGGDSLAARKPDALPVREAMLRAGSSTGIFVGDSIVDAEAARAAGIPFIAVSFGYSDRPVVELGADLLIDHFDALTAGVAVCLRSDAQ